MGLISGRNGDYTAKKRQKFINRLIGSYSKTSKSGRRNNIPAFLCFIVQF